ncbi:hypothetical protein GLOIN_2v1782174 [Rhizophagus clarus]|nr:hypothetical protein GLOIN_2v1782174 [Rhizophagus clarus]
MLILMVEKAFPFKVESTLMSVSRKVISGLEELVPRYISRKQEYAFKNPVETLLSTNMIKESILQIIYKTFRHDNIAGNYENEAEVDARVTRALQLDDMFSWSYRIYI